MTIRILVSGAAIIVGAIVWIIWRARSCSQQGCGVQELGSDQAPANIPEES